MRGRSHSARTSRAPMKDLVREAREFADRRARSLLAEGWVRAEDGVHGVLPGHLLRHEHTGNNARDASPHYETWTPSWCYELSSYTVARDVHAAMGCVSARGWTQRHRSALVRGAEYSDERRSIALAVARLGGGDALRLLVEQWLREDGDDE